jgi:exodeoxyribonuclease VII large subunit
MTLWEPGDPRIEQAAAPEGDVDDPTWSVAELGAAIGSCLRSAFADEIWLRGEIRSLRPANRNGHQYFDLIEPGADQGAYPDAKISVSLFRASRARVLDVLRGAPGSAALIEGVEVRIRGKIDWWAAGGQLRLVMSDIDPVFTLGQLDAQRRALLARLSAEGLLDANARRPLPPVPTRIGLVTSAGSAAHADFVHELQASRYVFDVVLADARVQGADAPRTLVAAIDKLGRASVDVIAIVRGGGSRTDLVAFDHPDVARAIAGAAVPVFTGVGHEIDRSVADEVAHSAFKTPTAVAGALIAAVADAEAELEGFAVRLGASTDRRLAAAQHELADRLRRVARAARVADARATTHLRALQQQLALGARRILRDETREWRRRRDRLGVAPHRRLTRAEERLAGADARLQASDPERLLARGWSLTRTADGEVVRAADQVTPGQSLRTTLATGTVTSTVTATTEQEPR